MREDACMMLKFNMSWFDSDQGNKIPEKYKSVCMKDWLVWTLFAIDSRIRWHLIKPVFALCWTS